MQREEEAARDHRGHSLALATGENDVSRQAFWAEDSGIMFISGTAGLLDTA